MILFLKFGCICSQVEHLSYCGCFVYFVAGKRTTKDESVQTDPVRILSKLPQSSDSWSASCMVRSNTGCRPLNDCRSRDERYSHVQKNYAHDEWECDQSTSSSDPELRSSRHCVTRDGHNSALSCQHVSKSRQHASLNESLGPSYRSRCQLKENSSASDHSSHSSVCERSECSHSHYSEAGKASWSNKRQWNQPPMANRSRPETELSGNDRSGQRNVNCFVSERSRHRSLPEDCPGNLSHAHVGATSRSPSVRPTMTTSRNRSQQYSGPNGSDSRSMFRQAASRKRSEQFSGPNGSAPRSKFRRIENRSTMNWQPRYNQNQAVRPFSIPPVCLPQNPNLLSLLNCNALPMLFPNLNPFSVPPVFFTTYSIPIPLWSLGQFW